MAVRVLFWNIQNFGDDSAYKGDYSALCNILADVAARTGADLIFIQELKSRAVAGGLLSVLQRTLCGLPAPHNNWYYDWIMGSVRLTDRPDQPPVQPPYATFNDLDWDAGHHEGYAMFWNQNITKTAMMEAAPVQAPGQAGTTPCRQSGQVRMAGLANGMVNYGFAAQGVITVPNQGYLLSAGTTAPNQAPLTAVQQVNPGQVLPAGTVTGPNGVALASQVYGLNPVVIPGNYHLPRDFTLPAAGTPVVPQWALSLALTGRPYDAQTGFADYAHGNPPAWAYLDFPQSAGLPVRFLGARRPAVANIGVVTQNGMSFLPVIAYHAPSATPASWVGMQSAAMCRSMYEVYNGQTMVAADAVIIGGDYNVSLDFNDPGYRAFTVDMGQVGAFNGGAGCNNGNTPLARVQQQIGNLPLSQVTANRSTVQVNWPVVGGQPILTQNPDDYRRMAIDNAFYRGLNNNTAPPPVPEPLYDLPAAISGRYNAFNLTPATVQSIGALPIFQQWFQIAQQNGAAPNAGNTFLDPLQTAIDLQNGQVQNAPGATGPARRSAELVRFCISDHLPVLFTLDV